MKLLNATELATGYTLGMLPDGRELLVVVAKGSFEIPMQGRQADFAEKQMELVEADTFTGEPGFSAPLHEVDYTPYKRHCDVLLIGSAYAPNGKSTNRVKVSLQLGPVSKSFIVTGNRYWESGKISIRPGLAEYFERFPICYDHAFGGIDNFHSNEKKHSAYMANPVGKGYHEQLKQAFVDGSPMPNTEELKRPVSMPNGKYRPMSFGALGRSWDPRRELAGTYDQNWLDNTYPFLPADFDETYFQSAPADQQMPYPRGGEQVILENLTPEGLTKFTLPELDVPVVFFSKKGQSVKRNAVIDTVVLEPDNGVFSMAWRASIPLKKNIFEIPQVLVGRKTKGWWRARKLGKTHYPTLDHLAMERRKQTVEED
jgi:hypothetical protein